MAEKNQDHFHRVNLGETLLNNKINWFHKLKFNLFYSIVLQDCQIVRVYRCAYYTRRYSRLDWKLYARYFRKEVSPIRTIFCYAVR